MSHSETTAQLLEVKLQLADNKLRFNANARDNPELVIDYFPPLGSGEGYTSLELLLASFGSCVSSTVLTLLRMKYKRQVNACAIRAKGTVREEHPRAFTNMDVMLTITSPDATETEVHNAIAVAEAQLCPVWSMLRGNVEATVSFQLFSE